MCVLYWSLISVQLCALISSAVVRADLLSSIVRISDGLLQGKEVRTYGNQSGVAFLGIPIAKPPVGNLRFRPPVVNDKWEGILSATQYRNACVSEPIFTYANLEGGPVDEDCLYINVFTNENCLQNGNCSVLAVVHGGGYTMESPAAFDSEIIVNNFVGQDRNIVVVTLPYRLSLLGWINISPAVETFVKPNLAIYDLERGFRWIQKEISHFGGDPRRVSALGHSAGGQIIEMLSLSPRFDDLFHSQILMSGTNSIDYNIKTNSEACRRTVILMGCAKDSTNWDNREQVETVLDCLMARPALDFLKAQQALATRNLEIYSGCAIDGCFFNEPFDRDSESVKLRPTLLGTVTKEFVHTVVFEKSDGLPDLRELRRLCRNRIYGYGYGNDKHETLIDLCVKFYNKKHYMKRYANDISMFYPTYKAARSFSRNGNKVYLYSFSYSEVGDAYAAYQPNLIERPIHSEDYVYILGLHRGPFTPKDYEIERVYTGIIAAFVNGKNPAPPGYEWPEFDAVRKPYFNIDFGENLHMPGHKLGYYSEVAEFWDGIDRLAGDPHPLTEFPEGFDVFFELTCIQGQEAHYKGISAEGRGFGGNDLIFFRCDSFFSELERNGTAALKNNRATSLNGERIVEEHGISHILLPMALISLVIAICYLGCVECYVFHKRSGYNKF